MKETMEMKPIDSIRFYRSELEKIYPNESAWLVPSIFSKWHWVVVPVYIWGIKVPRWIFEKPIGSGKTAKDAWENAYEKTKLNN